MATDYDQPRRSDADEPEDSLEELKARRAEAQSSSCLLYTSPSPRDS